jgi:hypothetical protein
MSRGIQQLLDMISQPPKSASKLSATAMVPLPTTQVSIYSKLLGLSPKSTKTERNKLSRALRELSIRCISLAEIAGIGTNVDSVQTAVREFFTDTFPPPQGSKCLYEPTVKTPERKFVNGELPSIKGFIDRVWVPEEMDTTDFVPQSADPLRMPIFGLCEDKRGLETHGGSTTWKAALPQLKGELLSVVFMNSVLAPSCTFPVPGILTNGTKWIFGLMRESQIGDPPSLLLTSSLHIDTHADDIVHGLIWFRGQVAANIHTLRALEAAAASEGGSGGDDSLLAGARDGTDEQGGPPSQGASGNSNGENKGGAPGHHPNVPTGTRNHLTVTTKIMNRIAQRGLVNPIDYYWPPRPILRG